MTDYIKYIRKYVGHGPIMMCGASVIVYSGGKILLQLRSDNNCWGCFGGCIELGEEVEDAARRELYEESGLTANAITLFNVFAGEELHYTYPNGDEVYIVDTVFICKDFQGEILETTDETSGAEWFDLNSLPPNISPPNRKSIYSFVEYMKTQSGGIA